MSKIPGIDRPIPSFGDDVGGIFVPMSSTAFTTLLNHHYRKGIKAKGTQSNEILSILLNDTEFLDNLQF